MKLINLTPHDIHLMDDTEEVIETVPGASKPAVVGTSKVLQGHIKGMPLYKTKYEDISGLPEKEPHVYYIVSSVVAHAAIDRDDLLVPSDLVRNSSGLVIGCKSFSMA